MNVQFKDWYTVSLLQQDRSGDIYRIEKETKEGTLVSDLIVITVSSEHLKQAVEFFEQMIAQRDNKYLIKCYEYIIETYNNGTNKILLRTEAINTETVDGSVPADYSDKKAIFMKNVGQAITEKLEAAGISGFPGCSVSKNITSCLLLSSRGEYKLGLSYWMDDNSDQNDEEHAVESDETSQKEQSGKVFLDSLKSEMEAEMLEQKSSSESSSQNERDMQKEKEALQEDAINASYYHNRGPFLLNGKIIILGVVLVLLGFAYTKLGGKQVVIPDGTGMEAVEFVSEMKNLGLNPAEGLSEYDDEIEKGLVSSVDRAGEKVQKGTRVYYHLSKGKQMEMIDVIGMKKEDAQKTLEDMGLKVDFTTSYSDTVDKGLVMDQSQEEGTLIDETNSIKLTISLGPDQGESDTSDSSGQGTGNKGSASTSSVAGESVIVPSLLDMTEEEGKQALIAAGLKVGEVYYEYSDTVDKGVVIRKSEATGDRVKRGTLVDITVSLGEED